MQRTKLFYRPTTFGIDPLKGNFQRIDDQGYCSLYHQVIINSKKTNVPVELRWPAQNVNNETGEIYPREKDDKDYHDYLLIIESKHSKINEILKWYRIAEKPLTIDEFIKQLDSFSSRFDFCQYWLNKNEEKYREGLISKQTYKNHKTAVNKLIEYRSKLPFSDINTEFGTNYRTWLKNQKTKEGNYYKLNTISGFLTKMKVYIKKANKEGFKIQNPFDKPIKTAEGEIVFLEKEELVKFYNY